MFSAALRPSPPVPFKSPPRASSAGSRPANNGHTLNYTANAGPDPFRPETRWRDPQRGREPGRDTRKSPDRRCRRSPDPSTAVFLPPPSFCFQPPFLSRLWYSYRIYPAARLQLCSRSTVGAPSEKGNWCREVDILLGRERAKEKSAGKGAAEGGGGENLVRW